MRSAQTVSFIIPGDIVKVTPSGFLLTPVTGIGAARICTTEKTTAQTTHARKDFRKRFINNGNTSSVDSGFIKVTHWYVWNESFSKSRINQSEKCVDVRGRSEERRVGKECRARW